MLSVLFLVAETSLSLLFFMSSSNSRIIIIIIIITIPVPNMFASFFIFIFNTLLSLVLKKVTIGE